MKRLNRIIPWILFLAIVMLVSTCESKPDCGCDGKKAFELMDEVGEIYYETDDDYATFISATLYTIFVLCNPASPR